MMGQKKPVDWVMSYGLLGHLIQQPLLFWHDGTEKPVDWGMSYGLLGHLIQQPLLF
jgi:hypothetical protein